MPALVSGIHVFFATIKDVDGRDKPGHDGRESQGLRKLTIMTGKQASNATKLLNQYNDFYRLPQAKRKSELVGCTSSSSDLDHGPIFFLPQQPAALGA